MPVETFYRYTCDQCGGKADRENLDRLQRKVVPSGWVIVVSPFVDEAVRYACSEHCAAVLRAGVRTATLNELERYWTATA